MDDQLLTPGGARERIAAWQGRIEKLAADTRAMGERMGALRVTAADRHRTVEVVLDSTGALVDLKLSRRASTVAPDALARTIMATVGEARAKLADRAGEVIADTLGTESQAARGIAASVRARLTPGGDA